MSIKFLLIHNCLKKSPTSNTNKKKKKKEIFQGNYIQETNTEQLKPNAKSVKVCLCKVAASSSATGFSSLGLPETGSS